MSSSRAPVFRFRTASQDLVNAEADGFVIYRLWRRARRTRGLFHPRRCFAERGGKINKFSGQIHSKVTKRHHQPFLHRCPAVCQESCASSLPLAGLRKTGSSIGCTQSLMGVWRDMTLCPPLGASKCCVQQLRPPPSVLLHLLAATRMID